MIFARASTTATELIAETLGPATAVRSQLLSVRFGCQFFIGLETGLLNTSLDRASLGSHPTDHQEGTLLHKSVSLQRRIDSWTAIQQLYMPVVSIVHECLNATNVAMDQPEDYSLCLPSAVVAASGACDGTLMEHEWKLRHSQAHDALHSLWQALHYQSYLLKFKD